MGRVFQLCKQLAAPPAPLMTPGVVIRTYRGPADTQAWLRLREEAIPAEGSGRLVRAWNTDDFHREFLSKDWWRPAKMWMAELSVRPLSHSTGASVGGSTDRPSEPAIVGSATLGRRGRIGNQQPVLHWLLVAPSWRRRGIGRALLASVERQCWAEGLRELRAETLSQWTAAVAFYRATGFELHG